MYNLGKGKNQTSTYHAYKSSYQTFILSSLFSGPAHHTDVVKKYSQRQNVEQELGKLIRNIG